MSSAVHRHPLADSLSRFQEAQVLVHNLRISSQSESEKIVSSRALLAYCLSQGFSKEWQDAAGRFGVVEMVVEIATLSDTVVQLQAMKVLALLVANHPSCQSIAGSAGALDILVPVIESSTNCELILQSITTIGALCGGFDANQTRAGAIGAIHVLLKHVRSSDAALQRRALLTLDGLTVGHEVNQSEMLICGCIPLLQEIANCAESDTQKVATSLFERILASNKTSSKVMGQALLDYLFQSKSSAPGADAKEWQDIAHKSGYVPMIVNVAICGDGPMQLKALHILQEFTTGHEGNKTSAGQTGVFALLLTLSRSHDKELQREALNTLKILVFLHKPNQSKAASADAVKILMELAHVPDVSIQTQALSCLANIVFLLEGSQTEAVALGALTLCTQHLKSKLDPELCCESLKFLDHVFANNRYIQSFAEKEGILPLMILFMPFNDPMWSERISCNALRLVRDVVHRHSGNQSEAGRIGLVELCVKCAYSTSSNIQKAALECLESLVNEHEVNQRLATAAGAISLCFKDLQSSLLNTTSVCKMVAPSVTPSSQRDLRSESSDEVKLLAYVEKLQSIQVETQISAIEEVGNFVRGNVRNQSASGELGLVQLMVQLAESSHSEVQIRATKCLGYLVENHSANQTLAGQSRIVTRPIPNSGDISGTLNAHTLRVLRDLFQNSDNLREAILMGASESLRSIYHSCKGTSYEKDISSLLDQLSFFAAAEPASNQKIDAANNLLSPIEANHSSAAFAETIAVSTAVSSVGINDADAFNSFVRTYDCTEAPEFCDQLLGSLRQTIFAACRKYGVSEDATRDFLKRLQMQSFSHKEELTSNMANSAALIWTSNELLRLCPGKTVEFCSLLNRILRERDPDLLAPACGVVRGINLLCVTRRDPSKLRYPPGGKSHRGGGLPLLHVPFFTAGKKFRVPMYLATSFDEEVAYR
jgi:hypothetical protein